MKEETKNVIFQAYTDVLEDNKLIILTTATTFIHSLIITGYIIWQIYIFLNWADLNISIQMSSIFLNYVKQLVQSPWRTTFLIIWGIIALVAYLLLPPIGYSAIIYRISGKTGDSIFESIWKWMLKFFPMFEFFGMISIFSPFLIFITISRLYFMGILDQTLIQIILVIRSLLSFFTSFFLAYAPFIIVLEDQPVLTAIRESSQLALLHIKTTFKFLVLKYFLAIRFIINILILLGIPMFVAFVALKSWVNQPLVHTILSFLFVGAFFLIAYINWIIEAFFISYWYIIYTYIKKIGE